MTIGFRTHGSVGAVLAGILLAAACAHAPRQEPPGRDLQESLEVLLSDDAFRGVQVGLSVRTVDPPVVRAAIGEDRMLTPGSTVKLFTSSTALARLGPSYAFITRLVYTGTLDDDGVLGGDLLVLGGGDPTFPYTNSAGLGIELYEVWGDLLRTLGFRRIDGRVIAVDAFFLDDPLGPGWCWDDQGAPFSAEVSSLNFADNCVKVFVRPGSSPADPGRAWLWPRTRYVTLESEVRTQGAGGPDSVAIQRSVCENVIRCSGTMSIDAPYVTQKVAVIDPALYAATVLDEMLETGGIETRGRPERRSGVGAADTTWVTEHVSPALWEILKRVNKDSDNLCAEALVRTLGRELGDRGDATSGLAAVREFATSCGVDSAGVVLKDGSGLSRLNALSAGAVTRLLACLATQGTFADFYQSLSIAGVDGTLKTRFVDTPAQGVLRGKSGSMTGVAALSGYSVDRRGDQIVFSILLNGYRADGGDLVDLVDLVALEILESSLRPRALTLR